MKIWNGILLGIAFAVLPLLAFNDSVSVGQVATPVVVYDSDMTTDRAKLYACYSLIEEVRLEFNRQSRIANADPVKYIESGKFRSYGAKVKDYTKQLLAERNRLKESILWATYTRKEWTNVARLSMAELIEIDVSLYGNRTAESSKATLAWSPLLDDLRATVLDDMPGSNGLDPTEDFTTYTEVDAPPYYLAVYADNITVTSLPRNVDAYVYKDKGVDYFNGNFEHLLRCCGTTFGPDGVCGLWLVTNNVDDMSGLRSGNKSHYVRYFQRSGTTNYTYLLEQETANLYFDTLTGAKSNTEYFEEIERDESVGSFGTLYDYICTGNYYDLGGTWVDTLSVALHVSKKDFRYIFGASSYNSGDSATWSGWCRLLDLQSVVARSWGYIIAY